MQYKDIVNKDVVNLSNCESEAIHIPGSIQPHGFLLGINHRRTVVYCSENVKEFIGLTHAELLGRSFSDIFSLSEDQHLQEYLKRDVEHVNPHTVQFNDLKFQVLIHASDSVTILEFESFPDEKLSITDLYSQTLDFVAYLEKSEGLIELSRNIAEETRKIIEYDRVMIYRFDKDNNGEVIAESKREDLESFLGLNYPHTDIPAQARELYMKNLLRLISDVNYVPVPIYKLDDQTSDQLDLSMSVLRSVSQIHCEYLNNMGVGATLTISLIHDQKLWGLIACHHYSPRVISFYTRLAAQLQGNFFASQIRVREVEEEHKVSVEIQKSLDHALSKTVFLTSGNYVDLFDDDSLLELANASGAAVLLDGHIYKKGIVPHDDKIRELSNWLTYFCPSGTYSTSRLVDDYEDASKLNASAAGIIYHTLGKSSENCIIWFRPEVVQTVNWAGDPNKSIEKNENGLSPRKSFELWKEIRKLTSSPWRESELLAASNFAYALQKQTYLLHLTEEEARYRKLNEKLQKTNSELENMNWISTHDLKEPLRKIQVFASMILDDEANGLSSFISQSITRMSESAKRMQTLLNDIMSYSQVKDKQDAFISIDLNKVLKELKEELKDEIEETGAVLRIDQLPDIHGIKFQVDQLFINLLRNSLKFSRKDVKPEITISHERVSKFAAEGEAVSGPFDKIAVSDNGIGFSNEYKTLLFEVFKRLHGYDVYRGNGIGLAISKKIMDNHNGFIAAEGEENVGATFYLYFPAASE